MKGLLCAQHCAKYFGAQRSIERGLCSGGNLQSHSRRGVGQKGGGNPFCFMWTLCQVHTHLPFILQGEISRHMINVSYITITSIYLSLESPETSLQGSRGYTLSLLTSSWLKTQVFLPKSCCPSYPLEFSPPFFRPMVTFHHRLHDMPRIQYCPNWNLSSLWRVGLAPDSSV